MRQSPSHRHLSHSLDRRRPIASNRTVISPVLLANVIARSTLKLDPRHRNILRVCQYCCLHPSLPNKPPCPDRPKCFPVSAARRSWIQGIEIYPGSANTVASALHLPNKTPRPDRPKCFPVSAERRSRPIVTSRPFSGPSPSHCRTSPILATVAVPPSPRPFSRPSLSHRLTSSILATVTVPPSPRPFSRPSPSYRQQPYRHLTRTPRQRYRAQHVEVGSKA